MVLKYDPKKTYLPTAEELPDSDETPVDNELQNIIPNLLLAALQLAWGNRIDWFFAVDMGLYYDPKPEVIVPDGFLSLGVDRLNDGKSRLSYVLWEENYVMPIFALEVVSKTYGGEYERKKDLYADLGILYYAVFHLNQKKHRDRDPLEVYKLRRGQYIKLESENPESAIWMPEIGLGIGRAPGVHYGFQRDWLYWYDADNYRLPTPEEAAQQEAARAEQAAARAQQAEIAAAEATKKADKLAAKLKALGIDPDDP